MTKSPIMAGMTAAASLLLTSLSFNADQNFAKTFSQAPQGPKIEKKHDTDINASSAGGVSAQLREASDAHATQSDEDSVFVKTKWKHPVANSLADKSPGEKSPVIAAAPVVEPAEAFVATAYSLWGITASGRYVSRGIIAADHAVIPLGSRVRLEAGPYSGEYLVADTGSAIRGHKIDIWMPSTREALRFGRRKVRLTVLTYGGKKRYAAHRRRGRN